MVRGDLRKKGLIIDTLSPTSSMRNLKYFLEDYINHKARLHRLDLFGALLQTNFNNRIFLKSESRYADYFQNIKVMLEEP